MNPRIENNYIKVIEFQPLFGNHDKTCCWMNGLYSENNWLNGTPEVSESGAMITPEKEEGDSFEGGWLVTAGIVLGISAATYAVVKIAQGRKK